MGGAKERKIDRQREVGKRKAGGTYTCTMEATYWFLRNVYTWKICVRHTASNEELFALCSNAFFKTEEECYMNALCFKQWKNENVHVNIETMRHTIRPYGVDEVDSMLG